MRVFVLLSVLTMVMTGCQSTYKLTYPKGKWQDVNQAGFIPSSAKVYYYDLSNDDNQMRSKINTAINITMNESVLAAPDESANNQSNIIQE